MPTIPADPRARAQWIRFQLLARGYTLAALGRELGVQRWTVWKALSRSYPRIELRIAAILGIPAPVLWPDRYRNPRRHGPRKPKEVTHA